MEREKEQARGVLADLARDRVITTRQLALKLGKSPRRAASMARSLQARGLLKSVQRGVYALVPLEATPKQFRPDPILVVHAALGANYVFSHFTALQLHGAEHNQHRTIHVSKPGARSRRLTVGGIPVHAHGVPEKQWDLAVATAKRGRATLSVTTPERTLLDLVGLPPKRQDYSEVVHAYLDLKPKLSMPDLLAESMIWGNNTTIARMGHLLAHHGRRQGDDPFAGKMAEFIALRSPYYFGTKPKAPGNRLDSTFNVVYPEGA